MMPQHLATGHGHDQNRCYYGTASCGVLCAGRTGLGCGTSDRHGPGRVARVPAVGLSCPPVLAASRQPGNTLAGRAGRCGQLQNVSQGQCLSLDNVFYSTAQP